MYVNKLSVENEGNMLSLASLLYIPRSIITIE